MEAANLLLKFWEAQMRRSHRSSNFFFRRTPSHYHMMLLVMSAYYNNKTLSVEELKTKLFSTSRPKSSMIINEACAREFFYLEKTDVDKRRKYIKPSKLFIGDFEEYLITLKEISN